MRLLIKIFFLFMFLNVIFSYTKREDKKNFNLKKEVVLSVEKCFTKIKNIMGD